MFRYSAVRKIEKEKFKVRDPGIDPDSGFSWLRISLFHSILFQDNALNFILHFFFIVLSFTVAPVFFSLHLLLIINISQTAKYVVKSITYRFSQLMITFILAIFMIYSYSIITADFFRHQFGSDLPQGICDNVYSCFMYSLNLGLRNGGGIGDSME